MSITYQQEFLFGVLTDIKPLLGKHWEEIALNKDKIKLNPDWEAYHNLEADNKLRIFTARDNGKLVGYFVVIVSKHIHYRDHLFAGNDIIFVDQEYRKSGLGASLINFSEKCLKDDGVSVLTINTKVHSPFDRLMDFLKFTKVERVYSKYIGK